eukprot:CAMPEP_0177631168 /NCGR_PEP_ID=MMETSP0447-20121125/1602_1 /TAXON_ID=0 /ORGANISM="Stygamoeba regulata, Strain BSH-02190019" /LENGTH=283 /DNA_ID=CAMNT_0019132627 /DNA_START=231 /DNA_END=1082 /DNA_ORIENTATION=+
MLSEFIDFQDYSSCFDAKQGDQLQDTSVETLLRSAGEAVGVLARITKEQGKCCSAEVDGEAEQAKQARWMCEVVRGMGMLASTSAQYRACVAALSYVLECLKPDLLVYPSTCMSFFQMLAVVCRNAEEVLTLPATLFGHICDMLVAGVTSPTVAGIARLSLEVIVHIGGHLQRCSSPQSCLGQKELVFRSARTIVAFALSAEFPVSLFDFAADAVYTLIHCDTDLFWQMATGISQQQRGEERQGQVLHCFKSLCECALRPKQTMHDFRRSFKDFVFVCKKFDW